MRLTRLVRPALAPVLAVLMGSGLVGLGLATGPVQAAGSAAPDRPTRVQTRDSRHDVWKFDVRQDANIHRLHPRRSPGRRIGDQRVVRVQHTADDLLVRLRVTRLGRLGYTGVTPMFAFRTAAAKVTAMVSTHPRRPPTVDVYTTYGIQEIDCPDATAVVKDRRKAVELVLPRTCLGDPSWVRTRSVTFDLAALGAQRFSYYVDVAPGPRLKIKGALTRRAWAPAGAVVSDSAPPLTDQRGPATARSLRRLGLAG